MALRPNHDRQTVRQEVDMALAADAQTIGRGRDRLALEQIAAFVNEHMSAVPAVNDGMALLERSLTAVDPSLHGLYCEFGVFTGTTINFIGDRVSSEVHGFDSFEGLPETWRAGFAKGTFRMDGLPVVRPNVRLHKGWFSVSIPVWAQAHEGPLAFVHFDADLYASTKVVFDLLGDRFVAGTVLQFDEFFNYPGWQDHEYRAFREFVDARHVRFEYIGYADGGDNHQVAVKILGVGPR